MNPPTASTAGRVSPVDAKRIEASGPQSKKQSQAHPASVLKNGHFEGISSAMGEVESLLQSELQSKSWFVDELLTYVSEMGGKRMRPALVLLAGQAVGQLSPEHIKIAAVVEMIHVATLVHDDILDGAETRRHKQTVNRRWDNQSSVLLGDYLFTHAFYLASTLPTTFGCRVIGEATNHVCAGELQQVGNRGNLELTEDEYLEIIRGKTAELCACSTRLGAHYSGADDELANRMADYGMELGIAFQIVDDLLDLVGDESAAGKSLGTDLENQKMTLPLIHLRDNAGAARPQVMRLLAEPITQDSRAELIQRMTDAGSIEYAKRMGVSLTETALGRLDGLDDTHARRTLLALGEFVISRTH